MNTLRLFFFSLVLASVTLAAEPHRHRESGITFPAEIAGATRGAITPYAPEEHGEAIAYRKDDWEITVFIRAVSEQKPMTAGAVVDQSLAAVRELQKQGMYSDFKLLPVKEGVAKEGWCRAAFQAKSGGQTVTSVIYGTVKGAFQVKVRLTTAGTELKSICPFVTELQRLVAEAAPAP